MTYLARVLLPLRNWFQVAFRWSQPSYINTVEDEDEWRRQHDEISRTVRRTMTTLIVFCLFCLLTLGAPDVSLLSTDAEIRIPIANTDISYTGFLVVGPIILISLTLYLHVFLEQLFHLAPASDRYTLPYLFNIRRSGASLLSGLILYWMVPVMVAVFTWKALPRAEAPFLVILTCIAVAILIGLQIRRFPRDTNPPRLLYTRMFIGTLWLVWAAALVICLLQLIMLLRPLSSQTTGAKTLLLPNRPLQLYNAQLNNKDLSGLNLQSANLRKANLRDSDLEDTTLTNADLRKADLGGANLTHVDFHNADLRGAILSGADLSKADLREAKIDVHTVIDQKWKMVWCLVNNQISNECPPDPNLVWFDLSGADLSNINLQDKLLIGVDFRGADLRGTDLTGADLRLADLRQTDLSQTILNDTRLEGILTDGNQPVSDVAVVTKFVNRTTDTCLEGPRTLENWALPVMSICDSSAQRQDWEVRRNNRGEIIIESVDKHFCLDSTGNPGNGVKPHMWDCDYDDFRNQHWKVELVENRYVLLSSRTTGFCLNSTGESTPGRNPHMWECDHSNHHNHWQMEFSK